MSRRPILTTAAVVWFVLAAGCAPSSTDAGLEARAVGIAPDGARTSGWQGSDVGSEVAQPEDGVAVPALAMASGQEPASVIVGHVIPGSIVARERPDPSSPAVAELSNPTPVGGPLAFQLVGPEVPEGEWTEVHLPVRPNGSTGWVRTEDLLLSANPYRIEVDRGTHALTVLRDNVVWLETTVAIGTGDTPTPVGRFYIIELLQPPSPDGIYGPFAFGLSGFSETLMSFAGGDGVIGIHGTNDPAALGTDVSHGCIRVGNDVIRELAGVIPLGTPVVIT